MTKKLSFIFIFLIFIFSMTFVQIPFLNNDSSPNQPPKINGLEIDPNVNITRLDELYGYLEYGGVPKDGIKAINIPNWISVSEVDYMKPDDIVFGVTFDGETIAIPRKILVQHEIMNLDFKGIPITISYCPLTGSTIGYHATVNGHKTTFGVSGSLINSNLVMYDRFSDSYWPQIIGTAVQGDLKGVKLEKTQVFWTTWEKWISKYPETLVQSTNTGYIRGANYNLDPYGSYLDNTSYYTSGGPFFWVQNYDPRLADKVVVIGIEHNSSSLAIEKNYLKDQKVINTQVGNLSLVVMYDEELDVPRVYKSQFESEKLSFSVINGKFIDSVFQKEWNSNGISEIGSLDQYVYMDSMWFGWKAFFPSTALLQS